ncbi:MAG: DUF4136 domain-containing protein [Chitinophagaceae bacterium]
MKTRARTFVFVLVAAFTAMAAIGCSATAHVEKDETVNFKKFKTYSWVSEKEKPLKERQSNHLIDKNVKLAVSRELQKNGWAESDASPEVLIDYNIMVENNLKEQSNPVYSRPFTRYYYNPLSRRITGFYYPSQMMGFDSFEIPYKEGTLTIHMIDNSTNKMIWQGWASDEVNSRNLSGKEITASVRTILRKFKPSEG